MSEILEERLYLGSKKDAEKKLYTNNGKHIRNIINISGFNGTREIPNFYENDDNYNYLYLQADDSTSQNIISYFPLVFDFIENAFLNNEPVLVHCYMGISRSASLIISYLMKKLNMTVYNAFNFVKHRRHIINPNSFFLKQLHLYQNILLSNSHQ